MDDYILLIFFDVVLSLYIFYGYYSYMIKDINSAVNANFLNVIFF